MRRQRPRTQLPPPPPPAEATEAFVEVDFVVVFPEVSYQALADQAGALAALAAELRAQWARTLNTAEEDVRVELQAGSLVVQVFAVFRGEDRLERADTTRKGVESFELVAETIQNSETIAAVLGVPDARAMSPADLQRSGVAFVDGSVSLAEKGPAAPATAPRKSGPAVPSWAAGVICALVAALFAAAFLLHRRHARRRGQPSYQSGNGNSLAAGAPPPPDLSGDAFYAVDSLYFSEPSPELAGRRRASSATGGIRLTVMNPIAAAEVEKRRGRAETSALFSDDGAAFAQSFYR